MNLKNEMKYQFQMFLTAAIGTAIIFGIVWFVIWGLVTWGNVLHSLHGAMMWVASIGTGVVILAALFFLVNAGNFYDAWKKDQAERKEMFV